MKQYGQDLDKLWAPKLKWRDHLLERAYEFITSMLNDE